MIRHWLLLLTTVSCPAFWHRPGARRSVPGGPAPAGLLAAGYAAMALDAQYHGDRAVYNDFVDPGEMVFRLGWTMRYANVLAQTVVDYRRAIDYLETRDDIGASRISHYLPDQ